MLKQKKNLKAYKETGKCGSFKGKKSQRQVSLRKEVMADILDKDSIFFNLQCFIRLSDSAPPRITQHSS